ncbi:hypothetical protein HPP92_013757 [Vanilla planifolia]|uniref:Coiled-coil domain-containing protein 47 n=1 Tax=Vanilla planifolia TaxID=51239 RepID=A0A835QP11_VANPL|nr:hypothetical protein HPP92_013757 [Vanilla planifolia]
MASNLMRWQRQVPFCFQLRGDALLFVLAVFFIFSHITHEFSRGSVLAADFEGFDAEDLDYDEATEESIHSHPLKSSPPPSTSLSQSSTQESHHGPPSPPAVDDHRSPTKELSGISHPSLELWDEDEFEGIPFPTAESSPDSVVQPADPDEPSVVPGAGDGSPPQIAKWRLGSFVTEIVCVSFLIVFTINYFIGKRQNELIALCWASQFATKGSVFDRNFSLLGTGDGKEDAPLLLKEGQEVFKFYASGRRYCKHLLATMELRSRHDLIARIAGLLFRNKDTITFEVAMNDDAMDNVVLALARKKMAKSMHKEAWDLQKFATVMANPPSGRRWVAEDLMVVTESREVAGDLINDAVIDQVFGDKAFEKFGKGFISLHFSDQRPGSQKKVLLLKFVLPDANNMADMTRLVNLVPFYIDLIGRYKLSSQARPKTETARAKSAQEAFKEQQSKRQEVLQKKKAEKKKQMEEAEVKLSSEVIRKREEKERARQMKKLMPKVKMMKSH